MNLAGFRIYVGTSPGDLQYLRTVGALDLTSTIDGLVPGTYFFAVTAVSDTGAESAFSNIESKTIT